MTALLGVVQFFLITYILIIEFRYKSCATFLWATLFIMFGIMHLIASFTGDYTYSNSVLAEASIFVIMFCLMYIFIRQIFGQRVMRLNQNKMQYENLLYSFDADKKVLQVLFLLFLIVNFVKLFPQIQSAGGLYATSWSSGRAYTTSLDYANSLQVVRIFFYALSGVFTCFLIKKQNNFFLIAAFLSLFSIIVTRNRIEILPLVCSLLSLFIFKNKKINMRVMLFGALSAVAMIYVIYGLRVFRHYGSIENFIATVELADFIERINTYIKTDNGELGLRKGFYHFILFDNDFPDFGKFHTYLRMMFVYLPTRWSFGLKPSDFAITMGQALGGAAGVSTHPTLFGDCYANLGMFGIVLGMLWGCYCNVTDWVIVRQKSNLASVLIYVLNAVVFVIIGRGSIYNGFWYIAYAVPLIFIGAYIWKNIRIKV